MEALGEVMNRLAKELELDSRLVEASIIARWPEVVGPELSEHTRARSLRDGILEVTVSHGGWAQQLNFLKHDLLKKLNRHASITVDDIRFRVGTAGADNEPNQTDLSQNGKQPAGWGRSEPDGQQLADDQPDLSIPGLPSSLDREQAEAFQRFYQRERSYQLWKREQGWFRCEWCGALHQDHQRFCPVCQQQNPEDKVEQAKNILSSLPWSSDGELKALVPGIPDPVIETIRSDLETMWWDELKQCLGELEAVESDLRQQSGGLEPEDLKSKIRTVAGQLAMLTVGIKPEDLSQRDLARILPAAVMQKLWSKDSEQGHQG